jgi:hypothetical protein
MFKNLILVLALVLCVATGVFAGQTCTVPGGTNVIVMLPQNMYPGVAPEGGRDVVITDEQPTAEEWKTVTDATGIDYSDGVVTFDEEVGVLILLHEHELTNCR